MKNVDEISRTDNQVLLRNVDAVEYNYLNQKDYDISGYVAKEVDKHFQCFTSSNTANSTTEDVLDWYNNALDYFMNTLDAMQSKRPFHKKLFEVYILNYHMRLLVYTSNLWNCKMAKFSGTEAMIFFHMVKKQEALINQYRIYDARLKTNYVNILSVACCQIFKDFMPDVLALIKTMKENYFYDYKGTITSETPKELFHHLYKVIEMYGRSPSEDVMNS